MQSQVMRIIQRTFTLVTIAAALAGCGYQHQLQDVARDWCMTIRASQVIPVYPLTEDLQPGDAFLVTLPSNEQEQVYDALGFLPLDVQVARLSVPTEKFDRFYDRHYFQADYSSGGAGKPRLERRANAEAFSEAFSVPRASFPTYRVDVTRAGGLKAAIPIQSIPVGVGLLAAESATASVTIADAYTYAADPTDLEHALQVWANEPNNRKRLLDYNFGRSERDPLFLRVIQRVYLIGGITVSITRTSQGAVGVDAGATQDVELLQPGDKSSIERFAEAQAALQSALNEGLLAQAAMPGASLRLASATSRSVTLNERFDRAIAIGYIAVDYEVRPDGSLGAALSTRDVLNGRSHYAVVRPGGADALTHFDIAIQAMHSQISTLSKGSEDEQHEALGMVAVAVGELPTHAPEFQELRAALKDATAGPLSAAKQLSDASNRYRASEAGSGPRTTMVYLALTRALRGEGEADNGIP